MLRIGVDVGGTNTDAVLMDGRNVVDGFKSTTTEEPGLGIINAVSTILDKNKINTDDIQSVMIGTTQFTNAFVENKKVVDYEYRLVKVMQNRVPADPEVQKIIEDAYLPHQSILNEEIGYTKTMLHRRDYWQSTMGNLVTNALRARAGTDVSFFPAWRYGATILPGKILAEDVYNVVPTDGKIITYKMKGKLLKELVENILQGVTGLDPYARVGGDMIRFSGMKIDCSLRAKAGNKIRSMHIGGKPLDENIDYSIAAVHTRFQNNPMFGATEIKNTEKIFVEELIAYIREKSPLNVKLDDRINLKTIKFN